MRRSWMPTIVRSEWFSTWPLVVELLVKPVVGALAELTGELRRQEPLIPHLRERMVPIDVYAIERRPLICPSDDETRCLLGRRQVNCIS
jgi:hypothetical protein